MKKNLMKMISGAVLAILILAIFAQVRVFAQDTIEGKQNIERIQENEPGEGARALEGSWSAQVTIRNCQTGEAIKTFAAMNTFMQGGTMQEYSVGAAPLTRGPGHGVWKHESGQQFTFAFQFFRFNADGTYAGLTKARRQVTLRRLRDGYTEGYLGTAAIEIFNAAGVLVGTACATETATRFE